MVQRVLVTAGASGIGLAIAKAFVAEGARVHICDIDQQVLKQATGERISGSLADVSKLDDVKRLMSEVKKTLGGLDVLVNNAGIAGPTAPVETYDVEQWQAVLDVNLNGTFFVTQQAIPLLKESPMASIVIMSSVAGRFGYPNRIAYSTTKWGLVGFAKTLAMELGPHGITCNSVHPGAVEGERIRRVLEGRAKASGRSLEEERENALRNQSIRQFIDPADVAALVVFLAGKHARTISGQAFPIDGDSKSTQ